MLISIIIPTRNRLDYVKLLIDDILRQDVSNYEIIVVDQSDDPIKISHCTHIISDTLGPCVSRNIGAKHAQGNVLVFLDDDARIYPDFIREITSPIINDRFDVVAGAICDPEGNYLMQEEPFLKIKNENFIKAITTNPNNETSRITLAFPAGCSAILTSVFKEVGGFEERFDPTGAGEDRDMALKLYKKGFAIWYNAKAKLLHTIAPAGGTRDLGSRTLMLDVHSYWMCKEHFSDVLADVLKQTILKKYKTSFYKSLLELRLYKTRYLLYRQVKKLLKS